jgi:tetratricopeptide (TPR) repeat protein
MEEAEKSFDMYIELAPTLPNPYDSKGDYFIRLGEYEHAYEQYMKAFEIDADFHMSYTKAMKIKSDLDTLVSID